MYLLLNSRLPPPRPTFAGEEGAQRSFGDRKHNPKKKRERRLAEEEAARQPSLLRTSRYTPSTEHNRHNPSPPLAANSPENAEMEVASKVAAARCLPLFLTLSPTLISLHSVYI